MLVVDIETKENKPIKQYGDGAIRKDGQITAISFYDGRKAWSLRIDKDIDEIRDTLATDELKIMHNAQYDMAWLELGYGIPVKGQIKDTLTRASLVEPTATHFNLDSCCLRMGIEGKNKGATIDEWWKENKPVGATSKAIENMDKIPFEVQTKYSEQDVKATWELYHKQIPLLDRYRLHRIEEIESKLIRVVMRMKKNGVRIDVPALDKMKEDWKWKVMELEDDLIYESGILNVKSPQQVAKFFHSEGINSVFETDKGDESWSKDALNAIDHPVAEKIIRLRSMQTILSTFLQGGLQRHFNGRIHCSLYPTNRDEGGTITGRFSSAHPNLQNIPARDVDDPSDQFFGRSLRKLFLPEEGHLLGAFDYKQIEYVIFAHFAIKIRAPGWQQLQEAMRKGVCYHQMVLDMLNWSPKMRRLAKTLNFGVIYGMGKAKCLKNNYKLFKPNPGQSVQAYTDWVYDTYFERLPFVKPTCRDIQTVAKNRGYVVSLGGRIHRTEFGKEYKSVNKLVQGSAADILKIGLVEAEEAGVWDVLPLHLTVHDEDLFSIPQNNLGREAVKELEKCMVTSDVYEVPIRVSTEIGLNWMDTSLEQYEQFMGAA